MYILSGLAFLHALWYVLTPIVKIDLEDEITINIEVLIGWKFHLTEIKSIDFSDKKKLAFYLKTGKIRFLRLRNLQARDRAALLTFLMQYMERNSAGDSGND